jgi:hypothetical protein
VSVLVDAGKVTVVILLAVLVMVFVVVVCTILAHVTATG